MTAPAIAAEFCTDAATKLRDTLRTIEKCLALLSVDQVWTRPNNGDAVMRRYREQESPSPRHFAGGERSNDLPESS